MDEGGNFFRKFENLFGGARILAKIWVEKGDWLDACLSKDPLPPPCLSTRNSRSEHPRLRFLDRGHGVYSIQSVDQPEFFLSASSEAVAGSRRAAWPAGALKVGI